VSPGQTNSDITTFETRALEGIWHEHATVLIARPLQILTIIVITLIIRKLLHRSIDRLVRTSSGGKVPKILSPLKDRGRESGAESSGIVYERRQQRAGTIGSVLKSAVSFVLFALAFLTVLGLIGLDLGPFIAGTSIVGVAIGFGAQNLVKDFLAGMFMILEDQYGVGDVIDVKEATGTVEAVGLRTTKLRDVEGTVWYVRNGEIIRVGNKSQQFAQVVVDVPIEAHDDLAGAQRAIIRAAESLHSDEAWRGSFIGAPEVLGVEALSREETVIRVTARVRPLEQWRVARELRGRIRMEFDTERARHRVPPEHRD
jgi:small conductance mechanosensitive channel